MTVYARHMNYPMWIRHVNAPSYLWKFVTWRLVCRWLIIACVCVCVCVCARVCIRLAKRSFGFICKNRRLFFFSFLPRILLNKAFCSTISAIFQTTSKFHFPQAFFFLIFLNKELFQVPFTVFQRMKILSSKWILYGPKWVDNLRCNMWWIWWKIGTSQPSYNSFCLIIKETGGFKVCFLLTNSMLFVECCF